MPAMDTSVAAFRTAVIEELQHDSSVAPKSWTSFNAARNLGLLQRANEAKPDIELQVLSMTDFREHTRLYTDRKTPIVIRGEAVVAWGEQSRPIDQILDAWATAPKTNVSVNIGSASRRQPSVEIRTFKQVVEKFRKKLKRREHPWNVLDSAVPTEFRDRVKVPWLGDDTRLSGILNSGITSHAAGARDDTGLWMLLAQGGAQSTAHVDAYGCSTWLSVQQGQIGFGWLVSDEDRVPWEQDPQHFSGGQWRYTVLRQDDTILFPAGVVHFVFRRRSLDSLIFGGHVLLWSQLAHWTKTMLRQVDHPATTNEEVDPAQALAYMQQAASLLDQGAHVADEAQIREFRALLKASIPTNSKNLQRNTSTRQQNKPRKPKATASRASKPAVTTAPNQFAKLQQYRTVKSIKPSPHVPEIGTTSKVSSDLMARHGTDGADENSKQDRQFGPDHDSDICTTPSPMTLIDNASGTSIMSDTLQGAIDKLDAAQILNGQSQSQHQHQRQELEGKIHRIRNPSKRVDKGVTPRVVGKPSDEQNVRVERLKQRLADSWDVSFDDIEAEFSQTSSKDFFQTLIKMSERVSFGHGMQRLRHQRDERQADKRPGGASRKRPWVPQDAEKALTEVKAEAESTLLSPEVGRNQSVDPMIEDEFSSMNGNGWSPDAESSIDQGKAPAAKRHRRDPSASSIAGSEIRRPRMLQNKLDVSSGPSQKTMRASNIGTDPGLVKEGLTAITEESTMEFELDDVDQLSPRRGTPDPPSSPMTQHVAADMEDDGPRPPKISAEARARLASAQQLSSAVVDLVIALAASVRLRWRAIDSSCFSDPSSLQHLGGASSFDTLIGAVNQHGHWTFVRCVRDTASAQIQKEHWDPMAGSRSNATVGRLVGAFLDMQHGWSLHEQAPLSEKLCPSQSNDIDCGVFAAVVCLFISADQYLPSKLDGRLWRRVLLCLVDGEVVEDDEPRQAHLDHTPARVLKMARELGHEAATARVREEKLNSAAHATSVVQSLNDVEALVRALDSRSAESLLQWQRHLKDSNEDTVRQEAALESLERYIGKNPRVEVEVRACIRHCRAEASLATRQIATIRDLRRGLVAARAFVNHRLKAAIRRAEELKQSIEAFDMELESVVAAQVT